MAQARRRGAVPHEQRQRRPLALLLEAGAGAANSDFMALGVVRSSSTSVS
jgi:hypothetical protein